MKAIQKIENAIEKLGLEQSSAMVCENKFRGKKVIFVIWEDTCAGHFWLEEALKIAKAIETDNDEIIDNAFHEYSLHLNSSQAMKVEGDRY